MFGNVTALEGLHVPWGIRVDICGGRGGVEGNLAYNKPPPRRTLQ